LHCIEYIFYYSGFLSNGACPENNRVAHKFFTVLNILFTFRSFEQLAFALKNKGGPEFSVLNIFFIIQDFEQVALTLKKHSYPEIFHCIEIFFIIHDF